MTTNLSRYRADLTKLLELGQSILDDIAFQNTETKRKLSDDEKKQAATVKGSFRRDYQKWYTEALAVVQQIIPKRESEFEQLYKGDGKRREINITTFTIQDWLNGLNFTSGHHDGFAGASMRFATQFEILRSAEQRFESALFDIKQIVQAELFDSELDAAKELAKSGYTRAAGAVSGVVLERHLVQVAANHNLKGRKQHPSIGDLNDALKNGGVIDVPTWRAIQRLGDLRNLCDHHSNRDPTPDEISELIGGVEKFTKTLY